jgi:fatty acid-binding protein DegV
MKNKCGILIDSSCCYDPQFIIENNVEVVPLSLSDGHNILYTDDNKKIDASTLLSRLDNGEVFKTSATPLGQLQLKIEDMLEKYENVIFLPISSGLSSQYHQSLIIKQDFPDRLFVVNSLSAASANEFILFHLVE